jgi:hypothetical protein
MRRIRVTPRKQTCQFLLGAPEREEGEVIVQITLCAAVMMHSFQ